MAEVSQILSEQLIAESLAVTIDKYQLLSVGITGRIDHRDISSPEELQNMFEAIPQAQATVIENTNDQSYGCAVLP
jgi:phytoene dehydrogenase-like protein